MTRVIRLALLLVLMGACGNDTSEARDRSSTFNCNTSSMSNTVLVEAQGATSPEAAAAEYVPAEYDAEEPQPTGSDGAMLIEAYDGDELVVRIEVAELRRGGGWWAISVDQCTDR